MDRVPKVSSAEVQPDCHVPRTRCEAVVVQPDVCVKEGISVLPFVFQPLQHRDVAKVGEQRVIDLDVAAPGGVQHLKLLLVRGGNVIEIVFAVAVHLRRERVLS